MSHNLVKELPPFTETCRLQQFYGSYNQLSDISGLAGLPELNYVDVDYNTDITDIECLKACQNLVQVNAFGTKDHACDRSCPTWVLWSIGTRPPRLPG